MPPSKEEGVEDEEVEEEEGEERVAKEESEDDEEEEGDREEGEKEVRAGKGLGSVGKLVGKGKPAHGKRDKSGEEQEGEDSEGEEQGRALRDVLEKFFADVGGLTHGRVGGGKAIKQRKRKGGEERGREWKKARLGEGEVVALLEQAQADASMRQRRDLSYERRTGRKGKARAGADDGESDESDIDGAERERGRERKRTMREERGRERGQREEGEPSRQPKSVGKGWEDAQEWLRSGSIGAGEQLALLMSQIPREEHSLPKGGDWGVATAHTVLSTKSGATLEGASDAATVVVRTLQNSGLLAQRKGVTKTDMGKSMQEAVTTLRRAAGKVLEKALAGELEGATAAMAVFVLTNEAFGVHDIAQGAMGVKYKESWYYQAQQRQPPVHDRHIREFAEQYIRHKAEEQMGFGSEAPVLRDFLDKHSGEKTGEGGQTSSSKGGRAAGKNGKGKGDEGQLYCMTCHSHGHDNRNCPSFKDKSFLCLHCKQPGHFARECPSK